MTDMFNGSDGLGGQASEGDPYAPAIGSRERGGCRDGVTLGPVSGVAWASTSGRHSSDRAGMATKDSVKDRADQSTPLRTRTPSGTSRAKSKADAGSGPTTVPAVPFVTAVTAEGLGLLVSWDPNEVSDDVTS